MSVEALTEFPSSLVAGDTLRVILSDADYPSSSWTLAVHFRGSSLADFDADSIAGNQFEIVIPASETAALAAGQFLVTFVYTETSSGERKTVVFGQVQVLPDPTAATEKTTARQTLEAMEAALLLISTGMHKSVSFNGQTMTKQDIPAMQDAIARQRGIVRLEEGSLLTGRRTSGIFIRFAST